MKIAVALEEVRANYDKTIDIVDGLPFSQKKQIRTIEFYNNSKYLNGQKDEQERDKPFYQILNAICDVENTAKDVDTKDINIVSDDGNHYTESWLMSKDIQVWMKESNFAKTLNDMRDVHTRYGSLLVKKVIKKGDDGEKTLFIEMPEWKNTITDQVDIINGVIVETHWMTPVQLSKMTEWKNIDKVLAKCKGVSKRIPVFEIRGEFDKATFKDCDGKKYTPKDEKEFSYQLYYVAGEPAEAGRKADVENFVPLYWEDDTERVYKYLARKPKAGRAFGVGVMEEGEEAQVWTNDAVLKQYRAMEYTTKVIGQTASRKLKGRNLSTETDDGTILEIEDGKPISRVDLLPAGGLQQYPNLIQQWYNQLEKTTSAYAAQRGETPPSGTPFRLQATVLQQSSSVFKTLQQEFGIFITELFEDWIMPYLATRLNKEHILSYEFSPEELKEIDEKFSISKANEIAKKKVLSGGSITAEEYEMFIKNYDEFIKQTKGQRFPDIPKNYYKNMKAKVTVNVTGEQRNKAATLESLINLYNVYQSNQGDPVSTLMISRILELSGAGISPVQVSTAMAQKEKMQQEAQEQQMMQQAQQQQQVARPQKKAPQAMSLATQ